MAKSKATKFPGVSKAADRHGRERWRFRKGAFTAELGRADQIQWGDDEFVRRYEAALAGLRRPVGIDKEIPGSFSALVAIFYQSAEFKRLGDSTKTSYRSQIEPLRSLYGDKRVTTGHFSASNAQTVMAEYADRPHRGNNVRKRLLALFRMAVLKGWRTDNPITATKPFRVSGEGHTTWSDAEIEQFFARWPAGTVQHLAVALMLYTGAARCDAVALGHENIIGGRIQYRRQKTRSRGGVLIDIPIHPTLLAVLPARGRTFLETAQGKPRSAKGFGGLMQEACAAAGLSHLSSHGLRKACARRLAEAGATASEIAAVTGHKGLGEVAHYTAAASRAGLADAAMGKMTNQQKKFVKTEAETPYFKGEDK